MSTNTSEPKREAATSSGVQIIAPGPRASLCALIAGCAFTAAIFLRAPFYVLLPLGITFFGLLARTNRVGHWGERDGRLR